MWNKIFAKTQNLLSSPQVLSQSENWYVSFHSNVGRPHDEPSPPHTPQSSSFNFDSSTLSQPTCWKKSFHLKVTLEEVSQKSYLRKKSKWYFFPGNYHRPHSQRFIAFLIIEARLYLPFQLNNDKSVRCKSDIYRPIK